MRKFWYIYLFSAIFILGSVLLPDAMYNAATKAEIVTVWQQNIDVTKTAVGKIVSVGEQQITAQCECTIIKMLVNDGDYVKKGAKIAKIDVNAAKMQYLSQNPPDYSKAESISEYIKSPASGRITKPVVMAGNVGMPITEGGEICTIIPTNSLKVGVSINENAAQNIAVGQKVSFTGAAFSGSYEGRVESVGAYAETSASGESTVSAVISIDKPDERLKSGYTVTAKITVNTIKNATCLPESAVTQSDENEYVYVYENGRATRKNVQTSLYTDGKAVIKSGIFTGEQIVEDCSAYQSEAVNVIAIQKH